MKKKVKKIPKYVYGSPGVNADYLNKISGGIPTNSNQGVTFKGVNTTNNWAGGSNPAGGGVSKKGTTTDGATSSGGGTPWGAVGAAATQVGKGIMHSFGVEDNSQLGVTLNNSMEWAELGGSIVPGWGHLIGGVAGAAFGAFQKGSVDVNTGEITYGGIFGRSKDSLLAESDMIKDNIRATQMTEQKKAEYAMNPNNPNGGKIMAAEGGIMRKPVDALVSKGELIYNPITKKLSQVPGSKGKPNKADDVYARLYEGDVVISNSPTMLMSNGKTPAQNLMGMVDRYSTGGTVKAREAIIKKVVNWQEANKTKPQEYAKFDEGWSGELKTWDDYLKNVYKLTKSNKIDKLDDFWGYDSKKKKYKHRWKDVIEHIGSNEALREKAIKDLGGLSYIGTGKDAWDNIVKAANDLIVGDVHRYFRSVGDSLQTNMDPLSPPVDHMTRYIPQQESEKLTKLTPEQIKQFGERYAALLKDIPKPGSSKESINWLDEMSGLLPVIGGLFDKYDWHTESSQITPPRFVPVNADPRPLLRAADESSSIGNYNLANMGVSTGAYMAHSAQLASDRAKRYADAYRWQQETNNKLIAQNASIYNDWRKQRDAYATQAIADTRANEAAAQQMRDQARKDRLEFYYGKRNDDMLTALMKPMFEYGTPDEAYRPVYRGRTK